MNWMESKKVLIGIIIRIRNFGGSSNVCHLAPASNILHVVRQPYQVRTRHSIKPRMEVMAPMRA